MACHDQPCSLYPDDETCRQLLLIFLQKRSLAGYVMSVSGRNGCIGKSGKSGGMICSACQTEYEYPELVRQLGEDEEVDRQVRKLLDEGKFNMFRP